MESKSEVVLKSIEMVKFFMEGNKSGSVFQAKLYFVNKILLEPSHAHLYRL